MTFAEVLEYISLIDWTILAGIPYARRVFINLPLWIESKAFLKSTNVITAVKFLWE